MNPDYATNGEYWCVFLARHSADKQKSDEFSRWWPEWHSYKRCSVSNDIIYGDRFEFRPSSTPPSTKYIQWSTLLPITGDKSTALVGPFTFAAINTSNRVRQTVAYDHWQSLIVACNFHGLFHLLLALKAAIESLQGGCSPHGIVRKEKCLQHLENTNYDANFQDMKVGGQL